MPPILLGFAGPDRLPRSKESGQCRLDAFNQATTRHARSRVDAPPFRRHSRDPARAVAGVGESAEPFTHSVGGSKVIGRRCASRGSRCSRSSDLRGWTYSRRGLFARMEHAAEIAAFQQKSPHQHSAGALLRGA